MAHSVATNMNSMPTQEYCGVYLCMNPYNIHVSPCQTTPKKVEDSHYLCEFEDPVDLSSPKQTGGIQLSPIVTHSSDHAVRQWIHCPLGYITHLFLACDVSSECWALRESHVISSYDSGDVPSYSTCPVTVTSRPPSYECATGRGRVPYTWVCDHQQDCSDNSDEDFCRHPSCTGQRPLQCGNTPQVGKEERRGGGDLWSQLLVECKLNTCTRTQTHAHTHSRMYTRMHTHTHTHTRTHTHTHTHTHIHTHTYTHTHTHTHIHIHTHTHTHTLTHTCTHACTQ